MSNYDIIGSSSAGNSIVYFEKIMVDVGLSFNKLKDRLDKLDVILLTHRHGDHFNKTAIKMIGKQYPNILMCVPEGLKDEFDKLEYQGRKFDTIVGVKYKFSPTLTIESFGLFHDVPNVGYKITYNNYKVIHATDSGSINHITAKGFDLYAIEHNYDEEMLDYEIKLKIQDEVFSHEIRSRETHLSFQQAYEWISSQRKEASEVIMLHVSSSYLK